LKLNWLHVVLTTLFMALLTLLLWNRIVITVYAGEGGVIFNRWSGTVVDKIYHEGLHVIFPWHIVLNYNLRVQERKHEFDVLSKQGLTIHIKVSIRFRPDEAMLGVLHKKIGPNYVNSVVIPEVESVIRRYFGQLNDEEIYTSKKAILEKIVNDTTTQLAEKFIILDGLIVRKIEFPKMVQTSIDEKIMQYHKYKAYEYRLEREKLEAERKVIEAKGINNYKNIISNNLTPEYLTWKGIQATLELAKSENAKVVIIGSNKNGLPIILNTNDMHNGKKTSKNDMKNSTKIIKNDMKNTKKTGE